MSRNLPTLDGWRAIAICLVLVAHGSGLAVGGFGVQIFFGLSGFLITTLLLREETKCGSISLVGFYRRRAFRILPAALAFLTLVGILGLCGMLSITLGRWLSALLFWANYSAAAPSWYVGHFWSLAVEEHFYLIWPAILFFVRGNRTRLGIALAAVVWIALWRMADFKYHLTWSGSAFDWSLRTDVQADSILFGVLFALTSADDTLGPMLRKVLDWPLTSPLSIIAFAISCVLPQFVDWKAGFALLSLRAGVVPVMILSTMRNPQRILGTVLDVTPMRWIGLISYSLYLWQQLFFGWVPNRYLAPVQWFPLNIAAIFVCATLSFFLIETPFIRLGKRAVVSRHRGAVEQVSAALPNHLQPKTP